MDVPSHLCERARTWASLRADAELSELESALLDAHLHRCASCSTFARGFETVAVALRSAQFEQPAPLALSLPKRHSGVRVLRMVAATVAVVGAGLAAAFGGSGTQPTLPKPVAMVAAADSPDQLRMLRRPGLVQRLGSVPRNRRGPGESV